MQPAVAAYNAAYTALYYTNAMDSRQCTYLLVLRQHCKKRMVVLLCYSQLIFLSAPCITQSLNSKWLQVLARVHEVTHSKVIPLLVELCNGPAGPLAAIDLNSPAPPADDKKKKKGKGAKPKKKVQACDILLAVLGSGCYLCLPLCDQAVPT